MNGNITKEGITKDLEAMHRIGVGGVFNLEEAQVFRRGLFLFEFGMVRVKSTCRKRSCSFGDRLCDA